MLFRSASLFVTALSLFLLSGQVSAQDADERQEAAVDERDEEARALFQAAQSAMADGRFQNAVDYFQRAYDLSGRPELLFNIGVAADRIHATERAVTSFEAYLRAVPDAENRDEVEDRIRVLRSVESDASEAGDGREPEPTASGSSVGPIVLMIGGGVVVGAGAVMLGYALAERSALESIEGAVWAEEASRHDRVPALSTAGIIALGVGGTLLGTGLVWLLTGGADADSDLSAVVGPGYLGVRGRL